MDSSRYFGTLSLIQRIVRIVFIIILWYIAIIYNKYGPRSVRPGYEKRTQTHHSLAIAGTIVTSSTPSLFVVDPNRTQTYYVEHRKSYGNKADFRANERLFGHIQSLNLGGKESFVLLGGTNDGQLSKTILTWCPNITFYGIEIQEQHFLRARSALAGFPNANIINMGWSENSEENVSIGGSGENAGLFNPEGQRGWEVQEGKAVNTMPLEDFAIERNITRALYVVIDTEGHEPKVIRGMELDFTENQERFSLFQFELGGTWAALDKRHGSDPWTQKDTVQALEDWGYLLFLAGENDWLAVDSNFFEENSSIVMDDEGYGPFVQGNLLAMHKDFVPPELKDLILGQVHYEV